MKKIIGLDIGGTKCAVILGEYDGDNAKILKKEIMPTNREESPYSVIDRLCGLIDKIATDGFDAIGISCGGPLDSKKGIVKRPPNLPLWDDIHITDILESRYGVPVRLQNDANACALAEWKLGAGKGYDNVIFMTFGTGLGAGLILDGKLYEGASGMAGEAGHIRLCENGPVGYGKSGSFEGFCSGNGISQLAYTLALEAYQNGKIPSYFDPENPHKANAKTVADAARSGDETAIEVYRRCGEYLGRGLSVLIDIINPDCIVIGSVFARSTDLLVPSMQKVINREALTASAEVCKVLPAKLGEQIGDFAALMTALQ